jgi:20S proteasome alpha/beta subunit
VRRRRASLALWGSSDAAYSGWKATCIGANNSTASSLLRQDYKDDIGLDAALELAVKVLSKTMDSTTLDSEKGAVADRRFEGQPVMTWLYSGDGDLDRRWQDGPAGRAHP